MLLAAAVLGLATWAGLEVAGFYAWVEAIGGRATSIAAAAAVGALQGAAAAAIVLWRWRRWARANPPPALVALRVVIAADELERIEAQARRSARVN